MQTFYKVVLVESGKLYSCIADFYGIEYRVGEFVSPKIPGSKLYVFDNLNDAKWFFGDYDEFRALYECEVINPTKATKIASPFFSDFKLYWENREAFRAVSSEKEPLLGTWECDSVRLVREIK